MNAGFSLKSVPKLCWLPAVGIAAVFSTCAAAEVQTGESRLDMTGLSIEQLLTVEISTASKFPQKTLEAPASVTIVTAADIKSYGYRTLADLLNSVRGMNVAYDRNYSYLGVRGSGRAGDFNSRILLMVDGYRINDPIYDQALIGSEFPLDMDLVDRVEVVRGPGSSIYGSNAVLGVVNVITKRGSDIDGAEVAGELASFNTDKQRVSYGKRYDNGTELLLSTSNYHSAGQDLFFPEFNSPANNNGVARNLDGDRYKSFFGKLSYEDITLTSAYSVRDKHVPTASYGTVFNDPNLRVTDESAFIDIGYYAPIVERWNLSAHVFQGHYFYNGIYPYAGIPNVLNKDTAQGDWWGSELKLLGNFNLHKLIAGMEYQDNYRQNQTNFNIAPYAPILNDSRNSTREGLYVQDEVTLLQGLLFNAGVRYDAYSAVGSSASPRLGLIWSPFDATAFKFLYGTAFRAPNAYELYYASAGSQKANPALKPEQITTYEFAVEHSPWQNFRLTADVYFNKIANNINQITDPVDGLLVFANSGQVDAQGVEFDAERLWGSGIRMRSSYAWQISRDKLTGAELVNSPRHLVKLNLSNPLWDHRLRSGLELQYTSSRKTQAGASANGHLLTNLTLLGERLEKNLELSATIYNLFDKRYSDPGGREHTQDLIAQNGRNFRLKLVLRF